MNNYMKPVILMVDDDESLRLLVEKWVVSEGYELLTAANAAKAFEMLRNVEPDLVLLDMMMPEMNGYEFCLAMKKEELLARIPVVFLTALQDDQNKLKCFQAGAVDYLTKPIKKETLLAGIAKHLKTRSLWAELDEKSSGTVAANLYAKFPDFKKFLAEKISLPEDKKIWLQRLKTSELHLLENNLKISGPDLAQATAEFCGLAYVPYIRPESIVLDKLPVSYCQKHSVIAIRNDQGKEMFVVANPFNLELLDTLKLKLKDEVFDMGISDFKSIGLLIGQEGMQQVPDDKSEDLEEKDFGELSDSERTPVLRAGDSLLHTAIAQRASDIHIEAKETHALVRLRVDGEMQDLYTLKKDMGNKLISRFKVLAGLNIAEKRKPQDGAVEITMDKRSYKLRLATTSTPSGESLIIRLLDPSIKPKSLQELGMTQQQVEMMMDFGSRDRGFVMIVGPTGSGKTTTIYSLLAHVNCRTRSLLSVEDPVEYRIPFANQQQVNDKVGITFESLLKSAMRQDPDVLFLGEVRDPFSAKAALDFASTGHMTITTMHTSTATTAVFRLERLGITRGIMVDAVLGIIAQRLLRKLCVHCKKIAPPTTEEREMLRNFCTKTTLPEKVANPVGCIKCNQTGYWGREGVYEIMNFDQEIAQKIRTNKPIAEIRDFMRERGDYLISHHAVEKVRQLLFSPKDVYEKVLVEEPEIKSEVQEAPKVQPIPKTLAPVSGDNSVLVVDDEKDTCALLARLLQNRNYDVVIAQNGHEALEAMGKRKFDLIISDVNMPKLDGFKMLEMMQQKGIEAPVLFLTGRTEEEDEAKAFGLGAVDYIKKPIRKEIFLLRVQRILEAAQPKRQSA